MPAVAPIAGSPQAELDLVGFAGAQGLLPACQALRRIIGMEDLLPAMADEVFKATPGILHDALADVIQRPIGPSRPDLLGYRFHQGAKLLFILPELGLDLLALGDVAQDREMIAGNEMGFGAVFDLPRASIKEAQGDFAPLRT